MPKYAFLPSFPAAHWDEGHAPGLFRSPSNACPMARVILIPCQFAEASTNAANIKPKPDFSFVNRGITLVRRRPSPNSRQDAQKAGCQRVGDTRRVKHVRLPRPTTINAIIVAKMPVPPCSIPGNSTSIRRLPTPTRPWSN